MAAVLSSMATFFIKSDTGESMPGSPGAGTSGDPADTENELKLGYGAFIGLADGEDIVNPNPGRPNEAFEPFVTAILQQVGAALELPMSLLIKMFKASYSASRGELLEAWKAFKAQRFSLVQDLCAPTWEAALSEYVARGLLAAPGFFEDAEIRAAWLQHEWIGPSAGSLDPEKEVNAAEKAINANLSTRDRETAALNGGDWITDQGQRAKEAKRIKADGTGTPAPAAAAPAEGTGQPDPKPGSDQEQEESN